MHLQVYAVLCKGGNSQINMSDNIRCLYGGLSLRKICSFSRQCYMHMAWRKRLLFTIATLSLDIVSNVGGRLLGNCQTRREAAFGATCLMTKSWTAKLPQSCIPFTL